MVDPWGIEFGSVTLNGGRANLEIPRIKAPALRVVVDRRAADRVHHRMRVPLRALPRQTVADCGDFAANFVAGSDQAANVVIDFVGVEEFARFFGHPGSGFDAGDFESGARQRQHGDAAGGAQPDHNYIYRFIVDGQSQDSGEGRFAMVSSPPKVTLS